MKVGSQVHRGRSPDVAAGLRSAPGTAIRDAAAAELVGLILCLAVASYAGLTLAGAAGVVLGVGVVAAACISVVIRPGRWSGPADRVTLTRAALIGGCATLAVLVMTDELGERPWLLVILLVPALALDAVDGAVARRTGTSSAAGKRLDGEMDAALYLILSIAAVRAIGWWVLAIGLMRYVAWVAGRVRPRQRGRLEFSQFRRVVAGLQGVMFAVALAPIVPIWLGEAALAFALVMLTISFGRDAVTLERRPAGLVA